MSQADLSAAERPTRTVAPLLLLLNLLVISSQLLLVATNDDNIISDASTEQSSVTVVDACEQIQEQHSASTSTAVFIWVNQSVSSTTASELSLPTTTRVLLVHCALPQGVDVTIVIVPTVLMREQQGSHEEGSPSAAAAAGRVEIVIANTTMQGGGSLKIVPGRDQHHQQQWLTGSLLQNIHITVDSVLLEGAGDILAIDTTTIVAADGSLIIATQGGAGQETGGSDEPSSSSMPATASMSPSPYPSPSSTPIIEGDDLYNVTMSLRNVVVSSATGNVASVLTRASVGSVKHLTLHVGGNSTIKAPLLIATVRATQLSDSLLTMDSSSECSGSGGGPIDIQAGDPSLLPAVEVAVLSILPPADGIGGNLSLSLENAHILVTDSRRMSSMQPRGGHSPALETDDHCMDSPSSTAMNISVAANASTAAIASIVVVGSTTEAQPLTLNITKNVSIDIALIVTADPCSSANQFPHSPPSTPIGIKDNQPMLLLSRVSPIEHILSVWSVGDETVIGVGGIVLNSQKGAVVIILDRCNLRLAFLSHNHSNVHGAQNETNGSEDIVTISLNATKPVVSALLGIVQRGPSNRESSFLLLTGSSNLTVSSSAVGIGNLTMSHKALRHEHKAITSTLGVGVCSFGSYSAVILEEGSSALLSLEATNANHLTMSIWNYLEDWSSMSVLGMAIAGSNFTVSDSSAMTIAANIINCRSVTFTVKSKDDSNSFAVSILGISVAFNGILTQGRSSIQVLFSAHGCDALEFTIKQWNGYSALAIFGTSVLGFLHIKDGSVVSVTTTLSNCSTFRAVLESDWAATSSLGGLAVRSLPSFSEPSVAVEESNLTFRTTVLGCHDVETMVMSRTDSFNLVASIGGLAVYHDAKKSQFTTAVRVMGASNVTVAFNAAKNDRIFALGSSLSPYRGCTVSMFGIALLTSTRIDSILSALTVVGWSSIVVASSIAECRRVTVLVDGGDGSTNSVFGIAVTNSFTKAPPTIAAVNVSNSSDLVLSSVFEKCDDVTVETILSWKMPHPSSLSVFGISVLNVHFQLVLKSAPPITFHIEEGSRLAIHALFNENKKVRVGSSLQENLQRHLGASATLGVALSSSASTTIECDEENPRDPCIEIWVGKYNGGDHFQAGNITDSTVVGMVATSFSGLSAANTAIGMCGTPPPQDAPFGLLPPVPGISIREEPSPASTWCLQRAAEINKSVQTYVQVPMDDNDMKASRTPLSRCAPQTPTVTISTSRSASRRPSHSSVLLATKTGSTTSLASSQHSTTSGSQTLEWVSEERQPVKTAPAEVTPVPTPSPTNATPTPQPTPRARTVKLTTTVMMPDNEVAATVVLSTAGASTAAASTLGSSGGGVLVVASSSVRMLECGLADDDPQPATFELPIQFPLGSGKTKVFAGAVLAHTILHAALLIVALLWRRSQLPRDPDQPSKVVGFLSMVFCGAHAFFTPSILGACSTILNNEDDVVGVVIAGSCSAVVCGVHLMVCTAVHRGPQNGLVATPGPLLRGQKMKFEFNVVHNTNDDLSVEADNSALLFSGQATKDILLTLFDGCRNYEKATHRHYASIETTLYSIISFISGARPEQNCNTAASAIGVLATAQLMYILIAQPFRTKLDTIFSTLNSLLLVVLSVAVATSLQQQHGEEGPQQWALKAIEVCLWLISALGFIQLAVQAYWAFHVEQRRRHQKQKKEEALKKNSEGRKRKSKRRETDIDVVATNPMSQPLLTVIERDAAGANKNVGDNNDDIGSSASSRSRSWEDEEELDVDGLDDDDECQDDNTNAEEEVEEDEEMVSGEDEEEEVEDVQYFDDDHSGTPSLASQALHSTPAPGHGTSTREVDGSHRRQRTPYNPLKPRL